MVKAKKKASAKLKKKRAEKYDTKLASHQWKF